jgi:hypothetical protein
MTKAGAIKYCGLVCGSITLSGLNRPRADDDRMTGLGGRSDRTRIVVRRNARAVVLH